MLGGGTAGTTLYLFLNPYWGGGLCQGALPLAQGGLWEAEIGGGHSLSGCCRVGDPWDPHVPFDGAHVMPGHSLHGMVMQREDLWGGIRPSPPVHPNCRGDWTPLRYHSVAAWYGAEQLVFQEETCILGPVRRAGTCARVSVQEHAYKSVCARGHAQMRQQEWGLSVPGGERVL